MAGLVLKLKPRERFMINGVVLQNGDRRSNMVVVTENVNVLRLKDAIHPEDANTPVSRVCYVAQMVLAGEADPDTARHQILRGIEQLSQVFSDPDSKATLAKATDEVTQNRYYHAMKNLRALLPREKRLLEMASA